MATIKISDDLKKELEKRKVWKNDKYEDVIWDLLENYMELSDKTKKNLEISRQQMMEGKFKTLEQVKQELGKL